MREFMKRKNGKHTVLLFLALTLGSVHSFADYGDNWIEQWGIRWTFNKNISPTGAGGTYQFGQFANGDYWVVGPVTLIGINPPSRQYQFVFTPSSGISGTFSSGERVTQSATAARGTVIVQTSQGNICIEPDTDSPDFITGQPVRTTSGDQFTPGSIDTRTINGSMINPDPSKASLWSGNQAFDSEMHAWHTTTNRPYPQWRQYCLNGVVNAARPNNAPVSATNPLTIPVHSSLVSSISKSHPARTILQTQAILTVLPSAPAENSFRPPYSGNDKSVHFTVNMLDYSRLLNLPSVDTTPIDSIAAHFEKPWIDILTGQMGQSGRSQNMPEYSQTIGQRTGDAALILNVRQSANETTNRDIKKTLLIRFVQLGIDNYGVMKMGASMPEGNWPPIEGQNMGHKLPIVFAGYLLGGTKGSAHAPADQMLNIPVWNPELSVGSFNPVFQEDLNLWYVTEEDIGRPVRGVNKGYGIAEEYTQEHVGLPEWGTRHLGPYAFPSDDDSAWNANYRHICATGMVGTALAIHMMGLRDVWNNPVFFDYHDRWYSITNGNPTESQSLTSLTKKMWDAYRTNYGPVWPDSNPPGQDTYTLTIAASNGSIHKSPDKLFYDADEKVTLTAEPDFGYHFSSWSGDADGNANPLEIVMNENKTISADFSEIGSTDPPSVTELLNRAVYSKLNSMLFTEMDDYISIPTDNWSLSGTSVTMWIYPDTVAGSHYLFGHTIGAWSNRIQLYIREGQLGLGLGSTHALNQSIFSCLPNQWYMITLSWDGSNYKVYVNNQLQAQGSYSGLTELNTFADIGNTGNPDYRAVEPFSGTISSVRIFAESLDLAAVSLLFEYGHDTGLTGHWKLDECTGNSAADASGCQQTAILAGGPSWGRPWADEHFLCMTTKNQALQIPSAVLSPEAGTIALWLTPADEIGAQYLFGHVCNSSSRIALLTVNGQLALSMGSQSLTRQNIAFLPAGRLTHIALTWNNGNYTVHVDGQQTDEGTYSGLTELSPTFDIGNYGDPALRIIGFLGQLEEVRTYNRALAADEIATLCQTYNIKQNRQLALFVEGTDDQGNPVSYTPSDLPGGAVFETGSQYFQWRPWYDQAGQYNILFNADGQPSQNLTISVDEVALQDWYRAFLEANGKL